MMADTAKDTAEIPFDGDLLTVALKSGGRLREARVRDFRATPIGHGQGLTATLFRVEPVYTTYESNAPRSLIVKMSSGDGPAADIARTLRFMERECEAYANIRRSGALRRPTCHHYALDPDRGDGILFLEDLGGLTPGDQIEGVDERQARAALTALASFHAEWWSDGPPDDTVRLPRFDAPEIRTVVQTLYDAARKPFDDNFARDLTAPFRLVLDDVGRNLETLAHRLAEPPLTILHGDFRADNLFFDMTTDVPATWAIDWQIACLGRGVFDAAYFISQSVKTGGSEIAERALIETYHQALAENGVAGYDIDRCILDYRRSVVYGLVYVVIAGGFLAEGDDRGALLCRKIIERAAPLALAHHGPDLL